MKNKDFAHCLPHVEPLELSLEGFTQDDVDDVLLGNGGNHHLLFGIVSRARFLDDLRQRGLQTRLEERGYYDFKAEMARVSPYEEGMTLTACHDQLQGRGDLLDLRAHWGHLHLPKRLESEVRALVWDWIELTDP